MGNHYHLLLETPRGSLSQIIHHINGAYTTYFNIKRDRSGHLFQGRFKGILRSHRGQVSTFDNDWYAFINLGHKQDEE